jgi:Flp pilus assembly protein TadG
LLVVFIPLVFGTIAAATGFSKQINITQSVREASRYGATYDITAAGGIDAWLTSVDNALMAAAGAQDSPLGGYDHRCVAYVQVEADPASGDQVVTGDSKHIHDGVIGSGPCPNTTAPIINNSDYVQVFMTRETTFSILFAGKTIQLDARSLTPYEHEPPSEEATP